MKRKAAPGFDKLAYEFMEVCQLLVEHGKTPESFYLACADRLYKTRNNLVADRQAADELLVMVNCGAVSARTARIRRRDMQKHAAEMDAALARILDKAVESTWRLRRFTARARGTNPGIARTLGRPRSCASTAGRAARRRQRSASSPSAAGITARPNRPGAATEATRADRAPLPC